MIYVEYLIYLAYYPIFYNVFSMFEQNIIKLKYVADEYQSYLSELIEKYPNCLDITSDILFFILLILCIISIFTGSDFFVYGGSRELLDQILDWVFTIFVVWKISLNKPLMARIIGHTPKIIYFILEIALENKFVFSLVAVPSICIMYENLKEKIRQTFKK